MLIINDWSFPYDQGHAQVGPKGAFCPLDDLGAWVAQGLLSAV